MIRHNTVSRSLIVSALLMLAQGAQATVSQDFSSDAAGWNITDLGGMGSYTTIISTLSPTYNATGGASGGYISGTDPSSNSFYFNAPTAFLGNLTSYVGGTFSFDTFYTPNAAASDWRDDPDVVLISGSKVLVWQAANNPGASWTHVSTSLAVGQGWKVGSLTGVAATSADFASVLGNVQAVRIRGEYVNGIVETTGLDNVVLAAVPEPESWAMLGAGLGLLGVMVRRRKAD